MSRAVEPRAGGNLGATLSLPGVGVVVRWHVMTRCRRLCGNG